MVRFSKKDKKWAISQYKLMCNAMKVGMKGGDDGATPWEAVCVLLSKVEVAEGFIEAGCPEKDREDVLKFIKAHHDSEDHCILKLWGGNHD